MQRLEPAVCRSLPQMSALDDDGTTQSLPGTSPEPAPPAVPDATPCGSALEHLTKRTTSGTLALSRRGLMNTVTLVAAVRKLGVRLEIVEGRLRYTPASRLSHSFVANWRVPAASGGSACRRVRSTCACSREEELPICRLGDLVERLTPSGGRRRSGRVGSGAAQRCPGGGGSCAVADRVVRGHGGMTVFTHGETMTVRRMGASSGADDE